MKNKTLGTVLHYFLESVRASIMNSKFDFFSYYFDNMEFSKNTKLLDVGCGGGKLIKLLSNKKDGLFYGVDISKGMVNVAKKTNADLVRHGKVRIDEASVLNLPYEDDTFDIVTAFRTIPLWPELTHSVGEIYRILKKGGVFVVINSYPRKYDIKWRNFVESDSTDGFVYLFKSIGFNHIKMDTKFIKNWIFIKAYKQG